MEIQQMENDLKEAVAKEVDLLVAECLEHKAL